MPTIHIYEMLKTIAQLHSCISIYANFSTQSQSKMYLDAQHLPSHTFQARPMHRRMKQYLRHGHHCRVCHLIKKKRKRKAVLMNLSRVLQPKMLESHFNFHIYIHFELNFVFSYFDLCGQFTFFFIAGGNVVNSLIRTNKVLNCSCLYLQHSKTVKGKVDQV